ncbi:heavy metal-associated isoprenylated plant protein 41-like [Vicia villosa]|uniref:heavy metal-associated isoprenylated plant protein 41-like n=1 Tax=Vicia villosa TaxID=3911 RepID=UPI00273AA80E|nr:heavy metal-associated isoprenylated plant protein 41-like [Vicia villosa]
MGSNRSDEGSKWLKHYCSDHQLLLAGEGDFSFTLCLAKAFASATNIVASSFDTHGCIKILWMVSSRMIRASGQIHVNHKTSHPYTKWNIEKLAEESFLKLMECSDFKKEDYTGYSNKRGDGNRCDKSFPLGRCSTFKFTHLRRKIGIAPSVSHCA